MTSKEFPFVGSLTSIILDKAFSIWVLENNDLGYLNESGDFSLSERLD